MDTYQLSKVRGCVHNIQDKLFSLRDEISKGKPYSRYCLEKLEPIKNDVDCLIAIFEEEKGNE